MKLKRISRFDNCKLENKHIRNLGLVSLSDYVTTSPG